MRLAWIAVVVAACSTSRAPWVPPPSAPRDAASGEAGPAPSSPAPTGDGAIAIDATLDALAVDDADFYRPVLYTWTTPAAIADLRASRQLLVATATSGRFVSPFNRALARTAARPGPGRDLARLLTTEPALLRRRYAWPAPFATVMGLGPRAYGNALVKIELAPEAWIGRFAPAEPDPFRFVDGAGRVVPAAEVLAAPARVAAIFHVRAEATQPLPFREYVVVNEAMVASWSIATPAIRDELARERALVAALAGPARELPLAEVMAPTAPAWAARARRPTLLARWRSAMAFDNVRYRLGPPQLAAIVAALDAYDGSGEPLEVTAPAP